MRYSLGLAHAVLFVVSGAVATAQPSPEVAFRGLLPLGHVDVTILQPAAPTRFTELAARLQQAARSNLEWWTNHVRSAPAGGRTLLYYDAKRAQNGQIAERAFRLLELAPR